MKLLLSLNGSTCFSAACSVTSSALQRLVRLLFQLVNSLVVCHYRAAFRNCAAGPELNPSIPSPSRPASSFSSSVIKNSKAKMCDGTKWPCRSVGPDFPPCHPLLAALLRLLPGSPRFQTPAIEWLVPNPSIGSPLLLSVVLNNVQAAIELPLNNLPTNEYFEFDLSNASSPSTHAHISFVISSLVNNTSATDNNIIDKKGAKHVLCEGSMLLSDIPCDAGLHSCVLPDGNGVPIIRLHFTYFRVTPIPDASLLSGFPMKEPLVPRFTGHRGLGPSGPKGPHRLLENSLESFLQTAIHDTPVKTIELDIQPTADGRTVVFHDWFYRPCDKEGYPLYDHDAIRVPVSQLTFEQMNALHRLSYEHFEKPLTNDRKRLRKLASERNLPAEIFDIRARSLRDVCDMLPADINILVELKYPPPDLQEKMRLPFPRRDEFVNWVLEDLFSSYQIRNRKIAFLCFEPDVCDMLALKQNAFPVYLSHCETMDKPCDEFDPRCTSLLTGLEFVKNNQLDGLMLFNGLLRKQDIIRKIVDEGIPILTYGDTNSDPAVVKDQFAKGVSGVIADDVHDLLKDLNQSNSVIL